MVWPGQETKLSLLVVGSFPQVQPIGQTERDMVNWEASIKHFIAVLTVVSQGQLVPASPNYC